jgi:hypothetical protein
MDKRQLQNILSQPFQLDYWIAVLKDIFGVKYLLQRPKPIELPSNDKADAAFELGSFNTVDDRVIGLYHVKVNPEVWLERNRVGLRALLRSVYKYEVDGALIVFEQKEKWRLSFVSEIRSIDEDGSNKKSITEPKRYTYLLGKEEKTNTPVIRLISLAGKHISLEDIRNAFSVEALNEEFYKIVARHFYQLVGATNGKGAKANTSEPILKLPFLNPRDNGTSKIYQEFAVRLIGRIVFCWFLKVKKSVKGISLLPENLLSSDSVQRNVNYFHSILEKLFFQTLNTPIDKRISNLPEGCEQIPFLNGGLFDPQTEDYYELNSITGLSDYLNTLIIPDKWFIDFFENLEQYNFTIDENSLVDIEVSVDPEMLGRIFENLLAEIDPISGDTARKATGSYYTPREIVNYMVTEGLINYLHNYSKIDKDRLCPIFNIDSEVSFSKEETENILEAIDHLKILDPACGSGAFPMGMLQKIVLALEKLDPQATWWKARQIAKMNIDNIILRNQIREKIQLTTVEYARKIGIIQNSLYGVDIQPIATDISKLRCFLSLIVDENIDDNKPNRGIEPLPNLEFKFITADSLIKLPDEVDDLFDSQNELEELQQIRLEYLQSYGDYKDELKLEFQNLQKQIFQYQLENFKIIDIDSRAYKLSIWNPFNNEITEWFDPFWMYGIKSFDIIIGNPPYRQLSNDHSINDSYKDYLKKTYNTSGGRLNTFIFFIHRGLQLLNNMGILCYIIPNTILTQDYYKYTREYILNNAKLLSIVNYENMPFANAIVENITLIIENYKEDNYNIEIFNDNSKRIELINLKDKSYFLKQNNYSFSFKSNDIVDNIFSRDLLPLDYYCDINQAIALKDDKNKSLRYTNNEGIFYKLLDGKDIDKYSINWDNVYLDFNISRIHSCKRKEIFLTQEKLLFRRVSENLIFTYDDHQYFALNTIVVVNKKDGIKLKLKFLLCLLNSKLFNYLYKLKFKSTKKVFSEIQAKSIGKLPIIEPAFTTQDTFEIIANYLLFLNKLSEHDTINTYVPNSHIVKLFEEIIDALVFELYFEEDFGKAGISFMEYAKRDFISIDGLDKDNKIKVIQTVYQILREKDNRIRQNLKLIDTRLTDLIMPIKSGR